MTLPGVGPGITDPAVAEQIAIHAQYAGYLARQNNEIERQRRYQELLIPEQFDYHAVRGLSTEVRQKLIAIRPQTIAQAQRISGITPAAISLLLVHLRRISPFLLTT